MENWVDYKKIKEEVSMEMVLRRYGVFDNLKKSGHNLVGCCPIHKGSNPRQFSVNLDRNIWNCFGNCKSGGNVLDFVATIEDVPLREAALLLQSWFREGFSASEGVEEIPKKPENKRVREENKEKKDPDIVNPPLKFELKSLKAEHQFFTERGILPDTVKIFGLGFCSKGMMRDRIAIPIHNEDGQLVAYCGRAVSKEQIEKEGKYKMPPNFIKSAVVYNLHRQKRDENLFILVESFLSVFKLYQLDFRNTLALMGSSLSERQEELIVETLGPSGQVVLLFDGDEDGQACTEDCLARLGRKLFVKALDISPYARKPHHLTLEQIKELI